jgi:hypothetical protein
MNPKIYSNLNNYLIIYTPKVIPWGHMDKQTNKRTDGQIFTQYSGISLTPSGEFEFAEISHYNKGGDDGTKWQDKD